TKSPGISGNGLPDPVAWKNEPNRCRRSDDSRARHRRVMTGNSTTHLQHCLDRLQAGDGAARDELLNAAGARLTKLARKMLRADARLRRWEETDDVLQTALMRLLQALRTVTPATPREFFRLSARQIRLPLIDLARHHYGPQGAAAHHETLPPQGQ